MKRVRKKRANTPETPVRKALRANSPLREKVANGLGAVMSAHRDYFDTSERPEFTDSLDIDEAFKFEREQEHRWDYLVGHAPSGRIVGVEPHSAENSEITTVVMKLRAARAQLRDHLRDGVFVAKWLWVASGKVQFAPMEKARFTLVQNGIEFVGRRVTNKHLK